MSAPPNFTNFAFQCGQGVPSDWTETHACSLYNSILADPVQHTKNAWTPAHIRWMMKSIWFCISPTRSACVNASVLRRQRATVFRWIHPFIRQFCHPSIWENAVCSPSFCQDLSNIVGEFWLATSNPVSSDADTGPSDREGNDNEDVGYGAAQRPASPMEVDPAAPEGEPSGDKTGEEWRGASEMRADLAAAWAAATLAALVVYGTSSDDGSEEEEEEVEGEVEQKSQAERKEDMDHDADDEREEEPEVDELEGGGASDAAPTLKEKGYTCTGWPVDLNQHLRQGKTQLAMRAYMVEMEEEGLLEPVDKKCSQCRGRHCCLLPVDSDNGHPACTECLISSHGCPNHITHSAPARKKLTRLSKGKVKAVPSSFPVKRPQAFVLPEAGPSTMPTALDFMVEFQSFHSHPMQERPTPGHDPIIDFAFNLAERCLGGLTHPREAAWDRILALTHQLIAAHWVLEYELRRSGPFSADEVEYLLQTRYPDSMLSANEEHREGSAEGKGDT
ncbi:hypothetical protein ARMGADRAFT_1072454 [Armillaria gallica]|uniref:Uncharacterized protein n=1 Tax=Armillaria gallica TaxID=47427 RepID=A0A2H3E1S3_ARMGA|nr:hypothetical protein ARMGADRAFT_1072454 [Armillaria gallica]